MKQRKIKNISIIMIFIMQIANLIFGAIGFGYVININTGFEMTIPSIILHLLL